MKALVPAFAISILLAGCGSDQGDDLDQFMQDAAKDYQGKIEPLPEVKKFEPIDYNADETLNDPFKPRKAEASASKGSSLQPNLNRPKEALEAFPLPSLQLMGVIQRGKLKVALIQTPENNVQQVKIGNYLGQNLGMVVDISDGPPVEVKIKEIVQDEITGEWTERPASIVQQEPKN